MYRMAEQDRVPSTYVAGARVFLFKLEHLLRVGCEDGQEQLLLPEDAVYIIETFMSQLRLVHEIVMASEHTVPIEEVQLELHVSGFR